MRFIFPLTGINSERQRKAEKNFREISRQRENTHEVERLVIERGV
jgi:hypothetical protein